MKPPKFRNGDIAHTWRNHKVRILKSYGQFGDILYETEDVHSGFKDTYNEKDLRFEYTLKVNKDDYVPKTPKCPTCKESWTKTTISGKKYYDCLKCNKTAEELDRDTPPKFDWSRIAGGHDDNDPF
jgi:hypothetical protein